MVTHALLILALLPASALPASNLSMPAEPPLANAVTGENIFRHLRAFQAIADTHGGNRATGTPGHDASAAYLEDQLKAAGYVVERQTFAFSTYKEVSPAQVTSDGLRNNGVTTLRFSGSGSVRGRPQRAGRGCDKDDFSGFVRQRIAVIRRGVCSFDTKTANAAKAGARAVVVVNQGGRFTGNAGRPQPIPAVGVSARTGKKIANATEVRIRTNTSATRSDTENVIAQTPTGRTDQIVMIGAHLDSVPEGPGINDNGSGSATVLEMALQTARFQPQRAVRFAWWGAEEQGLLGSSYYLAKLPAAEREKIGVYLNFDMLASPNHVYGIYDGDDSDGIGSGAGPAGSSGVEQAFIRFYQGRGLPYKGTDFNGRSDYGPFIQAGIPAGGLFTGAEQIKSPADAEIFGGTAGAAYDPCYHQACDRLENVDTRVLEVNADAVATVLSEYAGI